MIHCELVAYTQLKAAFHGYVEQLGGDNPARVVQQGNKPKGKLAYPLAYYLAASDPRKDTSKVAPLRGMLSFTMMCAGPDYLIAEVTGHPHGLRCMLQEAPAKRGMGMALMAGDGEQWAMAIHHAGSSEVESVRDWGLSCFQQFQNHQLDDLFGQARPRGSGYFLE